MWSSSSCNGSVVNVMSLDVVGEPCVSLCIKRCRVGGAIVVSFVSVTFNFCLARRKCSFIFWVSSRVVAGGEVVFVVTMG